MTRDEVLAHPQGPVERPVRQPHSRSVASGSAAGTAVERLPDEDAGGIVANTVFPIYLNKPTGSMGWSSALNLIPIADYELGDAVMNIVVIAPLGVLFALALTRSTPRRIIAAVAAVSLTIEVTQYVTAHLLAGGHIADVNDLLFNVIGGALGLGILTCLARLPGLNGVIVKLRWRDGGAASAESRSNEFGGAT